MSKWLSFSWDLDGWVTFETEVYIPDESRDYIEKMIIVLRKLGLT